MISGLDANSLFLLIESKYNDAAMKKARKDVEDYSKKASSGMQQISRDVRALGGVLGQTLGHVSGLFQGMGRLGIGTGAVALGIAALVKSAQVASKELNAMRQSAIALGISFSDMQRYKTGLIFSDDDLRRLNQTSAVIGELWQKTKNWVTALGVGAGSIGEKIFGKGQIELLGKPAEETLRTLKDQRKQLTMTAGDFQRYKLRQTASSAQDSLQLDLNLSPEQRDLRQKEFDQWYAAQKDFIQRSRFGFQTYYQGLSDMQRTFGKETVALFSDTFINALDGQLKSAREIFGSFFKDMRNMIIRFLMEQAVAQVFGSMFKGTAGGTNVGVRFDSVTPGNGLKGFDAGGAALRGFAHGGWAGLSGPEVVRVGEREPEMIIPKSKMGAGGEGGSQTVINNYINAVDPASFAELVARNPQAIVSVVSKSIKQNSSMRRVIRENT